MKIKKQEIIILNRKSPEVEMDVRAELIESFNVDEDGVGSLIVFVSGSIRTVKETPAEIRRKLC